MAKPTLFFLHALGASRHEWSHVIAQLGSRFDCIALDILDSAMRLRWTTATRIRLLTGLALKSSSGNRHAGL
ncbi:hypothetical protein XFF6970_960009 [Xanthomonas citri pv. fuscans]|nr:Alpha/Beta hydrolase fold protein [Xanthomonas citri pv. fuscans]SOO11710.1 hypothetical protein XFF6970_960009 [Xanthomonas citri pv. fuscans]